MSILDRIQQLLAAEINARSSTRSRGPATFTDSFDSLDDDKALRDAIDQAVHSSNNQSSREMEQACKLLDIPIQHTADALKSAWRKALLKWHPDLYVNAPMQEQEKAASMSRDINTAYFFLRSKL